MQATLLKYPQRGHLSMSKQLSK